MNPHARDALIGLTAVLAAIALGAMMLLFGELDFSARWTLKLEAPNTGGLGVGSPVRLNGVPVGAVTDVQTINEGPWQVRITAAIDESVTVSNTVQATIAARLIGGNAGLSLDTTPGGSGVLPTDGSALLQGPLKSSTMQALDERLGPVLATMTELGTTWTTLGGTMQGWLDDPQLQRDSRDLLHLAIASLEGTVEAMERFGSLAASLETQAGAVGDEALAAARELTTTLDQTTRLISSIRSGDGTLGQLATNPDAYNALESTAKELDRMARSLRLLIDQIREEGASSLFAP
ncbi:MAG: MlaD family protein [Phycisphaerales bacterium]|nr:MlaD family protein [Phycisphaerales bacterium]